jgi:hypothetical protein
MLSSYIAQTSWERRKFLRGVLFGGLMEKRYFCKNRVICFHENSKGEMSKYAALFDSVGVGSCFYLLFPSIL